MNLGWRDAVTRECTLHMQTVRLSRLIAHPWMRSTAWAISMQSIGTSKTGSQNLLVVDPVSPLLEVTVTMAQLRRFEHVRRCVYSENSQEFQAG